jgi:hypothetical protein
MEQTEGHQTQTMEEWHPYQMCQEYEENQFGKLRPAKTIYCHNCRQELPREAFSEFGINHDQFRRPQCVACFQEKYCNPKRLKARSLVHQALKQGVIKKPIRCAYCFRIIKLDGHHISYDVPLDLVWYCRRCHLKWHGLGL